jgi:hypothetical protein
MGDRIRGFEEQFEPDTANRIRQLIERIENLGLPNEVSRFYASDLSLCLSVGALLGSLHVASSLLELVVREMFIKLCTIGLSSEERKTANLQKELEEKKELTFKKLVKKLKIAGIFEPNDADEACDFYDAVRIPVHHGLPFRFIDKNTDLLEEWELLDEIFGFEGGKDVGFRDFEEVIEQYSLPLIEKAVGLIERIYK